MTTGRGEISAGLPGHTDEQLTGRVWLTQARGTWPIQVHVVESQVITWLKNNPAGVAWEYELTPVRRVEVITHEPCLDDYRVDRHIEPAKEEKIS
jgi:hypothetical protein